MTDLKPASDTTEAALFKTPAVAAVTPAATRMRYTLWPASATTAEKIAVLNSAAATARAVAHARIPEAAALTAGAAKIAGRVARARALALKRNDTSFNGTQITVRGSSGGGGGGTTGGGPAAPGPRGAVHPVVGLMDPGYQLYQLGIAMSGGASTGDFEVGAVRYLYDNVLQVWTGRQPRPDIITGTSVGAVNASILSEGRASSLVDLEQTWFELTCNQSMYVPVLPTVGAIESTLAGAGGAAAGAVLASLFDPFAAIALGVSAYSSLSSLYGQIVTAPSIYDIRPVVSLTKAREDHWSVTGPGLRGASISVVRDGAGHRVVFARGFDDMLYACVQSDEATPAATTTWSRWASLGGPIGADPVGLVDASGKVGVAAMLGEGASYALRWMSTATASAASTWSDFTAVENPTAWEAAPDHWDSLLTTFLRGSGGNVWGFARGTASYTYLTGFNSVNGGAWQELGASTAAQAAQPRLMGNVTGSVDTDGSILLFSRLGTGDIVSCYASGTSAAFSPWRAFGQAATSDVCVARQASGVLQAFWRGTDGQVHAAAQTSRGVGNDFVPLPPLGGLVSSNLVAALDAGEHVTVFARGMDDAVWFIVPSADAQPPPWIPLGAPAGLTILAEPFVLATQAGLEVYVVASDHAVWCISKTGAGWGSWIPLGGKVWTGIEMRVATVSLETAEARTVNQSGRFTGMRDQPLVSSMDAPFYPPYGDGAIRYARTWGVIASSSIPGIFPVVALNGLTWVDGGMRRGVPIRAAIDAGASTIFAIGAGPAVPGPADPVLPPTLPAAITGSSGPTPVEPLPDTNPADAISWPTAGAIDIGMRAVMGIFPLSIVESELDPETPWEVPVWVIQPTFAVHDAMTIERGLVQINYAYGWMRAADITTATDTAGAVALSDAIIQARFNAWVAEVQFLDAYFEATYPPEGASAGVAAAAAVLVETLLVAIVRPAKAALAQALVNRRNAGLDIPGDAAQWITQWELHSVPGTPITIPETQPPQLPPNPLISAPMNSPWEALTFTSLDGASHTIRAGTPPTY